MSLIVAKLTKNDNAMIVWWFTKSEKILQHNITIVNKITSVLYDCPQCLTAEEIASAFGIEENQDIPIASLPDMSLALVQQSVGGYCTQTTQQHQDEPTAFESKLHKYK